MNRLIVCTTCRREETSREAPSDGGKLFEKVRSLVDSRDDRRDWVLTGVECMSGCNRSCTIGLSGAGRPSYLFGDLSPNDETAADAVALVEQYCNSADGTLQRRDRPASFRRGILAKIPAAFLKP
jgi:predicted metal-binding protein